MIDPNARSKAISPFTFNVDKNKIRELCLAVGDNNPLFLDSSYAKKNGHKETPAPLTFGYSMLFWGFPQIWNVMEEIGLDLSKLLHVGQEYEYFHPIYPGDVIDGFISIEDILSSQLLDKVVFKIVYKRNDLTVLIAKMKVMVVFERITG